ncbi:MAG: virulence-associated E family protein [Cyanobacteria bacterium P01_F01_bin.3]
MSTNPDMLRSSEATPCPICEKQDGACAWTPDKTTTLCATLGQAVNANEIDTEATTPAPKHKPNKNGQFRTPKDQARAVNSAAVHIENKVQALATEVIEGSETEASVGVILAEWCKEHRHDKFAASRLLKERIEAGKKYRADYTVNEDHKLVRDDRLLREHFGDRLRFNELLLQPELDGELFCPAEARVELITRHDLPIKSGDKDVCTLTYRLAKENPFHPIRDYLNQVYDQHGDDTQIIEGFAQRYFGTPEPIHQAMVRRFFISAVARVMEPGCKNDCTLILKGAQSYGKSSFFEIMASKPWFDDSYSSTGDKDERLKLHYSWIVEWAELEVVFEKKSISQVKAFLSCSTDKIRPPYGLSQQSLHRPSVIVGSTNEDQFLADPTGNRRYWVVPMNKRLDRAKLRKERDRIWAAAVSLYLAGEQWWLTDEEGKAADLDRQQYEEVHPWTYSIQDYVYLLKEVSTREILTNALDIPTSKHTNPAQKRVATIFKKLGWEQTRNPVTYKERRTRVWRRKK